MDSKQGTGNYIVYFLVYFLYQAYLFADMTGAWYNQAAYIKFLSGIYKNVISSSFFYITLIFVYLVFSKITLSKLCLKTPFFL